jgi:hypothetical protein
MKPVTSLEQWVSAASRRLCDDAVERIHSEITDHYQAALASGLTSEAALASLGDPKTANRHYRRVYLTSKEVVVAGALANPRKRIRQAIIQDLVYLVLVGWVCGLFPQQLLWMLFWLSTPLVVFYPPNTTERCYNHLRIHIGKILFTFLFIVAFDSPTVGLIVLGICLPHVMISEEYRRWKVLRKLPRFPKGIPVVPEAPTTNLADFESCAFLGLRPLRTWEYVLIAFVSLGVPLFAFISPPVGGTLLAALSFAYLVPRFVSIKTPDRGRRFRRIKWCLFALTAVVPPYYVYFGYLEPDPRSAVGFGWAAMFTYLILLGHVLREPVLNLLRKKLPIDQWPERLHQ